MASLTEEFLGKLNKQELTATLLSLQNKITLSFFKHGKF